MTPNRLCSARATCVAASLALICASPAIGTRPPPPPALESRVSILVYHRFGPTVRDSMTVRTSTFESQLEYFREHRYSVVSLRTVVAYLRRARS